MSLSKPGAITSPRPVSVTTTTTAWCGGWRTARSGKSGNIATPRWSRKRWGRFQRRRFRPRFEISCSVGIYVLGSRGALRLEADRTEGNHVEATEGIPQPKNPDPAGAGGLFAYRQGQ